MPLAALSPGRMGRRSWVRLVAALLLGAAIVAGHRVERGAPIRSPGDGLERAAQYRGRARRLGGAERAAWLERACAVLEVIWRREGARPEVLDAALRTAAQLAGAGQLDQAGLWWRRVIRAPDSARAARARVARGDHARRAGQLEDAERDYLAVLPDVRAAPTTRAAALAGLARSAEAGGALDVAWERWGRLLDTAQHPSLRVDAASALVRIAQRRGHLAACRPAIETLRDDLVREERLGDEDARRARRRLEHRARVVFEPFTARDFFPDSSR